MFFAFIIIRYSLKYNLFYYCFIGTVCLIAVRCSVSGQTGCHRLDVGELHIISGRNKTIWWTEMRGITNSPTSSLWQPVRPETAECSDEGFSQSRNVNNNKKGCIFNEFLIVIKLPCLFINAKEWYWHGNSGHLSVTLLYCIQTAQYTDEIASPPDSPVTLAFSLSQLIGVMKFRRGHTQSSIHRVRKKRPPPLNMSK